MLGRISFIIFEERKKKYIYKNGYKIDSESN